MKSTIPILLWEKRNSGSYVLFSTERGQRHLKVQTIRMPYALGGCHRMVVPELDVHSPLTLGSLNRDARLQCRARAINAAAEAAALRSGEAN